MIPEEVKFPFRQGIRLILGFGYEILLPRQYRSNGTHGGRHSFYRINYIIIIISKYYIAVLAHKLNYELLFYHIPQLIPVLHVDHQDTLQRRLDDIRYPASLQMFPQKHGKSRRLNRRRHILFGKTYKRSRCPDSYKKLLHTVLSRFYGNKELIPLRLRYLRYIPFFKQMPQLIRCGTNRYTIKCHNKNTSASSCYLSIIQSYLLISFANASCPFKCACGAGHDVGPPYSAVRSRQQVPRAVTCLSSNRTSLILIS